MSLVYLVEFNFAIFFVIITFIQSTVVLGHMYVLGLVYLLRPILQPTEFASG